MAEGEDPGGVLVSSTSPHREWRQGDCVVGQQWFAYRAPGDPDLLEDPVPGFVVVSQSCDIERDVADVPFVEVAPLISENPDLIRLIEKETYVRRVYVPGIAASGLVGDISRTMSVDKSVVDRWPRTVGCTTDGERRAFARALARKYRRFPFAEDFKVIAQKLKERLKDKHSKNSREGRALRALHGVRVLASPGWNEPEVALYFLFVRPKGPATFEETSWEDLKKQWLALVSPSGRYKSVDGDIGDMEFFTMADYIESDPLDLDHLSGA